MSEALPIAFGVSSIANSKFARIVKRPDVGNVAIPDYNKPASVGWVSEALPIAFGVSSIANSKFARIVKQA